MRAIWVLGVFLLGSSATSPCDPGRDTTRAGSAAAQRWDGVYRNTGYGRDTTSLLRMVEPRLIINAEEEFLQTGIGSPESSTREFSESQSSGEGLPSL
ncbi:MAG: hypothetical protein JNM56_17245 [Planctomycetia bacterium]|nr:hypothetical protein [Planctomycetia bacterium]